MSAGFEARGWAVFDPDPALCPWWQAAHLRAGQVLRDPRACRANLRHGKTWFVGVDVMGCAPDGAVPGGAPLAGLAVAFARAQMEAWSGDWGRGQLSVAYPGYPRRDAVEREAHHRFRRTRAGAHLDGLLPVGPDRRRKFLEPHGVILGISLDGVGPGRSPLVVWEGSHRVLRSMMQEALGSVVPAAMSEVDLTDVYAETRKRIFETCPRVEIPLAPGGAVVLHRAALHGIAPWSSPAPQPRQMVYFRPELGSIHDWLAL